MPVCKIRLEGHRQPSFGAGNWNLDELSCIFTSRRAGRTTPSLGMPSSSTSWVKFDKSTGPFPTEKVSIDMGEKGKPRKANTHRSVSHRRSTMAFVTLLWFSRTSERYAMRHCQNCTA